MNSSDSTTRSAPCARAVVVRVAGLGDVAGDVADDGVELGKGDFQGGCGI